MTITDPIPSATVDLDRPRPSRSDAGPPVGRVVDSTTTELERLSTTIATTAAESGLRLAGAGVHPIPSGYEFRHVDGADWLLCPAGDDPLLRRHGRMPVPEPVIGDLCRLIDHGLDFPTVVIAHQLGAGRSASAPSAGNILSSPGRPASADQADTSLKDPPSHRTGAKAASQVDHVAATTLRIARVGARALGSVATAPVALLALDPIILGAVTARGAPHAPGTPAAWFELGRWEW